ncbi:hypothetical protein H072_1583 [Dactylellina haptotyla CBS 200.50]|uniref:Ubiquitin-like domain-containing protein n=1 Tax=Dactylellina haptotyla (strain CBS 200.50) TaxID=1284197 RepID=S8C9T7_DACHA|nr:hypothetical protein H072_1583 [Dactylellina haptotyla CBS 200.50]
MHITPLSLRLENQNSRILVNDNLTISFHRTIRVPDNDQDHSLPPSLGHMRLTNVSQVSSRLPEGMAAKGGLLLPMHQNEAMWISFHSRLGRAYAVKISTGGVNAITGEPDIETAESKQRRRGRLARGESVQDYVVLPQQPWLDGIATEPGKVRQFVATSLRKGLTVEAQITGAEHTGGLQFEITPAFDPIRTNSGTPFRLYVMTLTGNTITIDAKSDWDVELLKIHIQDKEGIPPDQQRLIYTGRCLMDGTTLEEAGIGPEAILHLVLRLRGGGEGTAEMGIAAGGKIKQAIHRDYFPSTRWDRSRTTCFNVQILNARVYTAVTGFSTPTPPISAETYKAHGGDFYDWVDDDDKSNIHGNFKDIKSIGQLTGKIDKHIEVATKKISSIFASSSLSKASKDKETASESASSGEGSSAVEIEEPKLVESLAPSEVIPSPKEPLAFKSVSEIEQELMAE